MTPTDQVAHADIVAPRRDDAQLRRWADALLLAASMLDIKTSPEPVRQEAAWTRGDMDDAIRDLATMTGLRADFVQIAPDDITPAMLPALLSFSDTVAVVSALPDRQLLLSYPIDGRTVQRMVARDALAPWGTCRLLLVSPRDLHRHEARIDDVLKLTSRHWLRRILFDNWSVFAQLGLGSFVGNLLAIATSLFAMQVWDRVVPARSLNTLWVLALGVGVALLFEMLIRAARVAIADHFGKHVDIALSSAFFARTLDIRNDARPRSPGTLISQMRDLEQLRELLTSTCIGVLIDLPFVVAFLGIIWLLGGPLVIVPLAAIPLIVLPGLLAQIPLARVCNDGHRESALRNAILMEAIHRVEDIKTLQAEPRFRRVWHDVNAASGAINLTQRAIGGWLVHGSQFVQQASYIAVLVVGVYGILDGTLSFGAVMACSILTSRTIAPLGQIAAVLGRVQNARVGKRGLDKLLALPIDHDTAGGRFHKASIAGAYHFRNVVYTYDADARPALTVPDLMIRPGERIAILGRVGAGKSTLLRLAAGLATPAQGQILLDGTPMEAIHVADVRRDTGLVMQDSSLFYGSLRDNMLMADPLATDDAILKALRISCADQLLLNQPQGLDLMLREQGQGLSGGQKQALLVARTLLRSPNVLLLDEPTASLDEVTETTLIDNLKAWLGPRTLIVATHRYPVLALVDRVIVVDNGRIVRDGPRDEVLRATQVANVNARPVHADASGPNPAVAAA